MYVFMLFAHFVTLLQMFVVIVCFCLCMVGDGSEVPGRGDEHPDLPDSLGQHGTVQLETVAASLQLGGRQREGGAQQHAAVVRGAGRDLVEVQATIKTGEVGVVGYAWAKVVDLDSLGLEKWS